HGYPSRRRSLVGDAKFETIKNREAKLNWLQEQRNSSQDEDLSEQEVLVVEEAQKEEDLQIPKSMNLILNLEDGLNCLPRILKLIESYKGIVKHLETRKSEKSDAGIDIFVREISLK
ncbi:tyrosine 3-monooxygenase-like protein, partial [Dinothrombium tinctorium]